jgi:putative methionine-R-sulfoxide reductase with GAF domain
MPQDMDRPWERMIRDLHRGFNVLEREISLLRDIDQRILSLDNKYEEGLLEDLFLSSISRFSQIHRVFGPSACYVNLGNEFVLLGGDSELARYSSAPIAIPKVLASLFENDSRKANPSVVIDNQQSEILEQFPGAKTLLVCPLHSISGDLLCAFVFADTQDALGSFLADSDFRRSAEALVAQLSIANNHVEQVSHQRWIDALWDGFIGERLSPTPCFRHLVNGVPDLLPNFGPLRLRGARPQVQILTFISDNQTNPSGHLMIRGTTGKEPTDTRIAVSRSICGYLVENPEKEFFLDDPTKPIFADRYRKYLETDGQVRTELAVALKKEGQLVGVLNLESAVPNAFNLHHRQAMVALAKSIAPLVSVLEQRLGINASMQRSVTSSTQQYLEALAGIFTHGVSTPLSTMNANINLVSKILDTLEKSGETPPLQKAQNAGQKPPSLDAEQLTSALREVIATQGRLRSAYAQI